MSCILHHTVLPLHPLRTAAPAAGWPRKTTRKGPNPSEDYNRPLAGRRGSVCCCHHHACGMRQQQQGEDHRRRLVDSKRQRRPDEPCAHRLAHQDRCHRLELTGSQASSSDQGNTVGPAWADWMNANGGINGHKVQVISVDDGGDPAKAQSAEKKLVDSDRCSPSWSRATTSSAPTPLTRISKNVPSSPVSANQTDWYTKAGTFVTPTDVASGLGRSDDGGQAVRARQEVRQPVLPEVAACGQAIAPQKPQPPRSASGIISLAVSSTATSYTAQCLQLQQQGVDYAQLNFTTSAAAKFVQDCQAQNYNPIWGTSEQATGKDLLSSRTSTPSARPTPSRRYRRTGPSSRPSVTP